MEEPATLRSSGSQSSVPPTVWNLFNVQGRSALAAQLKAPCRVFSTDYSYSTNTHTISAIRFHRAHHPTPFQHLSLMQVTHAIGFAWARRKTTGEQNTTTHPSEWMVRVQPRISLKSVPPFGPSTLWVYLQCCRMFFKRLNPKFSGVWGGGG